MWTCSSCGRENSNSTYKCGSCGVVMNLAERSREEADREMEDKNAPRQTSAGTSSPSAGDSPPPMTILLGINACIWFVAGAILFVIVLTEFSKEGMALIGFIGALFVFVFFAMIGAVSVGVIGLLGKQRGLETEVSSNVTRVMGAAAIIVGGLLFLFAVTQTSELGPIARYGALAGVGLFLAYAGVGLPCLGLNRVLRDQGVAVVANGVDTNVSTQSCPSCGKKYPQDEFPKFCENCGGTMG